MNEFPTPETYLKFFEFMPWKFLAEEVVKLIETTATKNARLLDMMCGPAYLLALLEDRRPDLTLTGIDSNKAFISYSSIQHPAIKFILQDVNNFNPDERYDYITCTGGLHHLGDSEKSILLERINHWLNPGGYAIIGDPYIGDYSNELERKLASAKLGYEYIDFTIKNGGTDQVLDEAIQILKNDIFHFENKTSISRIQPLFKKVFNEVTLTKTFPNYTSDFGDFYFVCRNI